MPSWQGKIRTASPIEKIACKKRKNTPYLYQLIEAVYHIYKLNYKILSVVHVMLYKQEIKEHFYIFRHGYSPNNRRKVQNYAIQGALFHTHNDDVKKYHSQNDDAMKPLRQSQG